MCARWYRGYAYKKMEDGWKIRPFCGLSSSHLYIRLCLVFNTLRLHDVHSWKIWKIKTAIENY